MWELIVSVPDHCLSLYLNKVLNLLHIQIQNTCICRMQCERILLSSDSFGNNLYFVHVDL